MGKEIALSNKEKTIVDSVLNRVRAFENRGELKFPTNYVPENALKSAWLELQEVKDKNYKPVLEVCTQASIANSLLNMVVQSLNPAKYQCYFIAYGNKLQMQRSYFGSMHVAKTVEPRIEDIYAATVYEGDEFVYEIRYGKKIVTLHKQKIENVNKQKIVAVYATVLYKDGRALSTVMTYDEVKQAWLQSPMKVVDEKGKLKSGSTHDKFTADMAEKTVINKACKYIINSSDDSTIVAKYAKTTDIEVAEADVEEEINENANQETLDIKDPIEVEGVVHGDEPEDTQTEPEEPEEKPKQKAKAKAEEEDRNLIDMAQGPGY